MEPGRLKRLLENVLVYDGGASIDTVVVEASKGGLIVKDMSLDIIAVHNAYGKKFFITFDPELEGEEKSKLVPLSKSLLDQVRGGFASGDDKVMLEVEGEWVHLRVPGDHYRENLVEFTPPDMGELEFQKKAKQGYILKGHDVKMQVLVKAADLSNLPDAEHLTFRTDGTAIAVHAEWEGIGDRTKALPFTAKTGELEEGYEIQFDSSYFQKVVKQFTGNVWLTLGPAKDGSLEVATLSQATKEFLTTYVVSAI